MSKKAIAMLVAVLSLSVSAFAADSINFDQGVDVKGLLANIKTADAEGTVPAAPKAVGRYMGPSYDTRDCATFTFNATSPLASNQVQLRSTEMVQECYQVPVVTPGPNGTPVTSYTNNCYERPGNTWSDTAQVIITGAHQLLPWETESMQVCLEGPFSNISISKAAYKYNTTSSGSVYTLSSSGKVLTDPDAAGVALDSFTADKNGAVLKFSDKWSQYYAGEQIKIHAKLKNDPQLWFDSTVSEQDFMFTVGTEYAVNFTNQLKNGRYSVEWGFTRMGGTVSTTNYVKGGESSKIDVK